MQFKHWMIENAEENVQVYKGKLYRIYAPPTHGGNIVGKACHNGMPGVCIDTFWTPHLTSIGVMCSHVANFAARLSLMGKLPKTHKDEWTIRVYQGENLSIKDVPKQWQWASTGAADVNEVVLASLDGAIIKPYKINGKEVLDLSDRNDLEDALNFGISHSSQHYQRTDNPNAHDEFFDPRRAYPITYNGQPAYINVLNKAKAVQIYDKNKKLLAVAKTHQDFQELDKNIKVNDDDTWMMLAYLPGDLWGVNY